MEEHYKNKPASSFFSFFFSRAGTHYVFHVNVNVIVVVTLILMSLQNSRSHQSNTQNNFYTQTFQKVSVEL